MTDHDSSSSESVPQTLHDRAVLIDTGAFLALVDSDDCDHESASRCLTQIASRRLPLFVALPTLYETHRRLLFDHGIAVAQNWLTEILDGSLNLIRPEEADEREAVELIDRYEDLRLTLTDAVNMAVMTRRGVAKCFSFDDHFLQAGFLRVPPLP